MKMNKLTVAILIAMLLGIVTGQGYRLLAPARPQALPMTSPC
jgi:Na+/H+-dicarboxylate symporter